MNKVGRFAVGTCLAVSMIALALLLSFTVNTQKAAADTAESRCFIGNVAPAVTNVLVEDTIVSPADNIVLSEGTTTAVTVNGTITDLNGYGDAVNATAVLYDSGGGTAASDPDDNNDHYTNSSCILSGGSGTNITATCTFDVLYYANGNTTWTGNITATDNANAKGSGTDTTFFNILAALSIPATIDYGTLNVYDISAQVNTTVTNTGNWNIDLSLDGYGNIDGDGLAMNCTGGDTKNITLSYEKYNATAAGLSWDDMVALTDSPVTQTSFDLGQQTNDVANSTQDTYWRLKVPTGVEGTCKGRVVFTAVQD